MLTYSRRTPVQRYTVRLIAGIFLLLLIFRATPQPASAHPLGNFSVNRYSHLTFHSDQLQLDYVLDMAEIPTFQMWESIDTNGDNEISNSENASYRALLVEQIQANLDLALDGEIISLTPDTSTLQILPGQGDLPTLRWEATFWGEMPASSTTQFTYTDHNYPDRLGWREIVVSAVDGVQLPATVSHLTTDISQGLTAYPDDLLQNPPDISSINFSFASISSGVGTEVTASNATDSVTAIDQDRFGTDRFAELISITEFTPRIIAGTLIIAFILGAFHALSPGHGKTIVAAYLVGSRGTAKHALLLGLTTTVTHTAGVFIFGFLVLVASQFFLPEQLYPYLGVMSGLLVVAIGFSMLRGYWLSRRNATPHTEEEGYHTHFGIGHTHTPPRESISIRNLLALGVSGGLLPCPSALVVLLSAIALQRVGFGLILILVFSLGLASVLTAIGIALVYAGRLMEKMPASSGRLLAYAPMLSALFITVAGAVITVQAIAGII